MSEYLDTPDSDNDEIAISATVSSEEDIKNALQVSDQLKAEGNGKFSAADYEGLYKHYNVVE